MSIFNQHAFRRSFRSKFYFPIFQALNDGSEIPSSLPPDIIPLSKREGGVTTGPALPPNAVQVRVVNLRIRAYRRKL